MRFSLRFSRVAGSIPCISVICMSGALWLASSLAAQTAPQPRILVYTRNYTPDGKGYVHDNIASSVAAIRKMGEESGFVVDARTTRASSRTATCASMPRWCFRTATTRPSATMRSATPSSTTSKPAADSSAFTRLRDRSGIGLTSGRCWAANSRPIRTSSRSLFGSSIQTSPPSKECPRSLHGPTSATFSTI